MSDLDRACGLLERRRADLSVRDDLACRLLVHTAVEDPSREHVARQFGAAAMRTFHGNTEPARNEKLSAAALDHEAFLDLPVDPHDQLLRPARLVLRIYVRVASGN